jgi:hypothetical protein
MRGKRESIPKWIREEEDKLVKKFHPSAIARERRMKPRRREDLEKEEERNARAEKTIFRRENGKR